MMKTAYRADIDGLRAVAVLSVIFFHADFPWAKGGFSGVDVFFVISGYLITGIVRRELDAATFSFARFYERRARRILPALLLVTAATLAACLVLMLPADLPAVGRSAVSVLAFAANIAFWRGVDFGDLTLVNYFGRRIHEQPLVHTWSLGVEEQYYLLFPLLLFLVWRVRRSLMLPALIAGTLASMALSVALTPGSPGAAFYLLPTRAWELLAGGLVSWYGATGAANSGVREAAAACGFALVVMAVLVFDSATPFPGYAAVLPVAGATLLLGYAPGSRTGAFLSLRPLVFVGLISYSAYLWHQPLFALARYVSLSGDLDRGMALNLCIATLILATLSWRYVETPFRDSRVVSRRRLAVSLAVATLVVAVPASILGFAGSGRRRTPVATNLVGQAFISLFGDCTVTSRFNRLGVGCLLDPSSAAPPAFLVVGDSHAGSLLPAFAEISKETGVQGRLLELSACSPLVEVTEVPTSTPACLLTRERALQMVAAEQIGAVFLVSRFSFAYGLPGTFEARLAGTIDAYSQRGALVHLVAQVPEQPGFRRRAYIRAMLAQRFLGIDASPAIDAMTTPRAEHDRRQASVRSAFERYRGDARVRIVDATDVLCDHTTCRLGTIVGPYYSDEQHLTAAGALLVGPEIARQSALPRPH
jgi:peptidoglycan/LPS O-acetylase OafA/YrhL